MPQPASWSCGALHVEFTDACSAKFRPQVVSCESDFELGFRNSVESQSLKARLEIHAFEIAPG